ncbi:MAG: glycosyltransferase family 2 protein [Myxococcota bacterium]
MSTPIVIVPVTIHIHLLQQQLLCLSRWHLDCPDVQFVFFVDDPHPTAQQLLLLFQSLCPTQILPFPTISLTEWALENGQSTVILEPEAIPHPDLLRLLLDCPDSLRLCYIDSSVTALRWFPQVSAYDKLPNDDMLMTIEPQEESCIGRHDEDCLKWSAFREDIGLMTAVKLSQVITVHHADVTGTEGNALLSPELRERLSSRQKAASKIKSSHTNVLFHPVHALIQPDGQVEVYAIQETMKMGGVSSKAAVFMVKVQNDLLHQIRPKPLKLSDFPLQSTPLRTPVLIQPSTLGKPHRLVFSTIMRNEADKFLHDVISHAAQYVDAFLVIDDCSTDESIEVCRQAAGNVPLYLYSPPQPLYLRSEFYIRSLQWALTAELNPEWILLLDADEVFEDKVFHQIEQIMKSPTLRVGFPKFDMWNETEYRDDEFWCPHNRLWAHLIRYRPEFTKWHKAKVHSGRHPLEYMSTEVAKCPLRIKHLGWSREAERRRKHEWYLQIDDKPYAGNAALYSHIMDPNPTLKPWDE